MEKIKALINELEQNIPKHDLINIKVSNASVGWHIEHTLLTFNLVMEAMKKSNPADYKWQFNLSRTIIMGLNIIPRGKARAPKIVQPKNDFTKESLQQHVALAKQKLKYFKDLQANNYFEHPYFGNLNLKPTIKFLKLHTKHHLKIINDIVRSN
jgi:hypothetical protein